MIILAIISSFFLIRDPSGEPLPGAWVGDGSSWFAAADAGGLYVLQGYEPDTISITFTGYETWRGPIPGFGETVTLGIHVIKQGQAITVTASRGALSPLVPSTAVLGSQLAGELSQWGTGSLNGVVPGVTVREYGGAMPITSVSLRGQEASSTDWMIDGISVVSPRDGMPTGMFDPGIFESIEVARGGSVPGSRGSGAGGAVNFLSPSASQPFFLRLSAVSEGGGGVVYKNGRTSFSLRRTVGGTGNAGWNTSALLTAAGDGYRAGFLGGFARGAADSPQWTVHSDGHRSQGQTEAWLALSRSSYECDISAGAGTMSYSQTVPYETEDTHSDVSGRLALAWKGPLRVQGALSGFRLESTAYGTRTRTEGSLVVTAFPGIVTALAGLRSSPGGTGFLGRLNLRRELNHIPVALHGALYTDFRAPTMNDLYWPDDGMAMGNHLLENERTTGGEAGAAWMPGVFSVSAAVFKAATTNLILWLPGENSVWTPSNISRAHSRGVEADASVVLPGLEIFGTFTWNPATDETQNTPREGMLLPYRPEYTWGAGATLETLGGLTLGFRLQGAAKRFINRTQTEFIEGYTLASVSTARPIGKSFTITLGVNNLSDAAYQVSSGFPGRGRTYGISITYNGGTK